MKILMTGSSGLVGTALRPALATTGHQVFRLVRSRDGLDEDTRYWNPDAGEVNASDLEGFDAVIHLAGDNIADGRWSAVKKQRIRDSRVKSTRLLCDTLARLRQPPKVLLSASGIGIYGQSGDEWVDEASPAGAGFLAGVCREWEAATQPTEQKGIRVVRLRFGLVLSTEGGALAKMLLPFKLGLGGVVGGGQQWWSWISINDVTGIIQFLLEQDSICGPVNMVAPQPVTNREFTRSLGRVLHRPTLFPLPAFVARLALGEMADETLLASTRARPARLLAASYSFRHHELGAALQHLFGGEGK